jgi:GNAT superfamily N-acetyltransferase
MNGTSRSGVRLKSALLADLSPSCQMEIAALQAFAYGVDEDPVIHDPALRPVSFCLRVGKQLVAYAGVVFLSVQLGGTTFAVAGLSGVATQPGFQRRGYGFQVVRAASNFVASSGVDLGIFTCDPGLIDFYRHAGNWQPSPSVVLVGNQNPKSLASDTLGLTVMLRQFSDRAREHSASLLAGRFVLGLPVGQFL